MSLKTIDKSCQKIEKTVRKKQLDVIIGYDGQLIVEVIYNGF